MPLSREKTAAPHVGQKTSPTQVALWAARAYSNPSTSPVNAGPECVFADHQVLSRRLGVLLDLGRHVTLAQPHISPGR
ncbi:MAG: hypothetical protein IPO30_19745 [Hyphomonadaceae bacterium]|nr:hypothetical protein [Hyphomonadaceae bacterium]